MKLDISLSITINDRRRDRRLDEIQDALVAVLTNQETIMGQETRIEEKLTAIKSEIGRVATIVTEGFSTLQAENAALRAENERLGGEVLEGIDQVETDTLVAQAEEALTQLQSIGSGEEPIDEEPVEPTEGE